MDHDRAGRVGPGRAGGERRAGAVTIASPVRDAAGEVVAVVYIAAASLRMRPPRAKTMTGPEMQTAHAFSLALGYRPEPESSECQASSACAQASRIASA